jgi:hypothetical protein
MAVFTGNGSVGSPSFTFSSDTNTGIYRADADKIAITTNGVAGLTVDSGQKVGINTTNPTYRLTMRAGVSGNTFPTNVSSLDGILMDPALATGTQGAVAFRDSGGGAAISFSRGGSWDTYIRFGTNAAGNAVGGGMTERMVINAAGSVGINTASPGWLLDVNGSVRLPQRRIGYIFANGVSAGTSGSYDVDISGFSGQGAGTLFELNQYYLVTFLSFANNHIVQGVGLYCNNESGGARFLATLGAHAFNGTITFTASGTTPRVSITNATGNIPSYYAQIAFLN